MHSDCCGIATGDREAGEPPQNRLWVRELRQPHRSLSDEKSESQSSALDPGGGWNRTRVRVGLLCALSTRLVRRRTPGLTVRRFAGPFEVRHSFAYQLS